MTKAHTNDIRAIIPLRPDVAKLLKETADRLGMDLNECANWLLENIAKQDKDEF